MRVFKVKTVDTLAKLTDKGPCGGGCKKSIVKLAIYQQCLEL